MAVTNGTIKEVSTLRADIMTPSGAAVQWAFVVFTMSGTYAQGDNSSVLAIPTAIQNSRRNGKTVTLRDAMLGQAATKASDPTAFMSLKTVAVSTNDVTFEITDADHTTELANGAIPDQERPFGLLVAFTEA